MMQITVNGEARTVAEACTVRQLLEDLDLAGRRVAVEVNREIVPRSQHGEKLLAAGDQIEVVQAIGGG